MPPIEAPNGRSRRFRVLRRTSLYIVADNRPSYLAYIYADGRSDERNLHSLSSKEAEAMAVQIARFLGDGAEPELD